MNLLVVSSLTPGTTALYLIDALKALGCGLHVVSDLPHPVADALACSLFDVNAWWNTQSTKPDAVLFVEGGTRRLFPVGMESLPCPTAWYAIDTHVHTELHVATARLFDLTFVAQAEFLDRFGSSQVRWLPLAAPPELFANAQNVPRDLEVAYVGSEDRGLHPERSRLLDVIRKRYSHVYLGRARPEDMGSIYGRARIVFNKSVRNDVNMRYFEAMCAGAALVTDRLTGNGVQELFTPGVEFAEYEDEASLVEVLDRLLNDEAGRAAMAERGRARVLARHTYRHRAETLLEALAGCRHSVRPGPHHYMPVFHLLRFPEGVMEYASRSLEDLRSGGDRNAVLALVALASRSLAGAMVRAYRARYRLRHRRLSRRARS